MASNYKSKGPAKESPTEPFKHAVTGCLRAIARKPDLEVAFAAERPGLIGGKVRPPPPAAKKLVELWRPLIEGKAGRSLDRLERLLEDQRRFGDAVHDVLDALEMGEDRSRESDEDEDADEGRQDRRKDESGEEGDAADSDEMQRMSLEEAEACADEMPDSAAE